MDFLELFNEVAKLAKPAVADTLRPVSDEQESFKDSGLDSLDLLLITVYMCEIYGIPEAVGKDFRPTNVSDFIAFVTANGTKQPESVAAAIESVS